MLGTFRILVSEFDVRGTIEHVLEREKEADQTVK
jgi:hypothetical protein